MRQRTISDFFWCDPSICDLSQEDKATLLYFLTSPHSNIIGVYQIVWMIAAAETGWTKDQLVVVVKRLQEKGLIGFNQAGWIWVKIWWNHNSPAGAFSPKLIQSAKKQCAAMPSEWLGDFLNSLELKGIDRVSIGYQYPTDTLPPNTNRISNSNTTTTTAELEFPKELSGDEKKSIIGLMQLVQFLPLEKQQELLDELAGAIRTKSIKVGSVAFFNGLVDAVQKRPFIPSRGVKILEARNAAASNFEATAQRNKSDITQQIHQENIKLATPTQIAKSPAARIASAHASQS